MSLVPPPIRRLLPSVMIGLAVGGLVLAMLVGLDVVPAGFAVAAVAAVLLAAFLGFELQRADVAAIEARAIAVAEGAGEAAPVEAGTMLGRRAAIALARAERAWRRRQGAVRVQRAALEAILEALHDPLLLLGSDRQVRRANAAARDLLGDRLDGRDLAATLRNPQLLDAVDQVLAGGPPRTLEFTVPVPVETTFEARVIPFRPDATEPDGEADDASVIVTLHDISAIKRSDQMRADFVANASHELRTPLAALLGFIETLRGAARDDADARERFLAIMQDQAGRMSRLVNDLLSLSRIEQDERTPPASAANVGEIVRTVAATLELRAAARRVRIRIEAPERVPDVQGDADQLAQVFQNLVDNAVKYTREETEVTVRIALAETASRVVPLAPRAGRETQMVSVAVIDRGEGIPRTHLPRLTERFYRVDTARSRQMGGTGLGLAIVKHIVNRHRGRLSIDSEVGRGSVFTVMLPVARSEERRGAEAGETTAAL
ncbi:MAG: ATP-binding protein [Rhodospirillales bacterium]|jgi:two-component system phosphate regulon sensor histidine kinase PhoR